MSEPGADGIRVPDVGRPARRRRPKWTRPRKAVPHRRREDFRPYQPVHVTVRVADWVWNLRSRRSSTIILGAVRDARERSDFRIVDYSIQGNHLHPVIEAEGARPLGDGIVLRGHPLHAANACVTCCTRWFSI